MIPLSTPYLKGNEIHYVVDALQNEWVSTSGNYVTQFEKNIAQYLKVEKAVACQSGTAALHLALMLCDVTCEDEVIVPTLTFIAAVNPVKYLGASPIFMDCDDTLNMDVDKVEAFLKKECLLTAFGLVNKNTHKRIKVLIVVHVFGNMANVERLRQLCDTYHLKLVEDATEALGTYYTAGPYTGKFAGTIGDFGAYSFNGNKIITTGGGGMLVGHDSLLLEKARYLSTQAKDDPLYYLHNTIGYNYRMTNLQAAVGVAQLECLEEFITLKIKNYTLYKQLLTSIEGLNLLPFNPSARNNYWFYALYLDGYKSSRDNLLNRLSIYGIQTRPIWKLIHTQPMYLNHQVYQIEKAPHYHQNILNVPCSVNLHASQIQYIIDCLIELQKQISFN